MRDRDQIASSIIQSSSEEMPSSGNSAYFQTMIDALDFYVFLIDENHHIVMANKAVGSITGKDPSELIGKHCPKMIHGVDGSFHGCPLEIAIKSGNIERTEVFDGINNHWLDSRIYPTPFRTPAGLRIFLHFAFDITEKKAAQSSLADTLAKLRASLGGIIQVAQEITEKRDPYTAGHQSRVADLARAIATEMNLSEDQIDSIRMAGVIHDIGKISIPVMILTKPGRLSESEFALIKEHSRAGYEILKNIGLPWPIANIVLQHHERMDGSGYPSGLKGDEIMLEARIIAVADVVEAIASDRPYRAALGIDKALEEISIGKGKLYDQKAVDACLMLIKEKGYKGNDDRRPLFPGD